MRRWAFLLLIVFSLAAPSSADAQPQCGVVDRVDFPVDVTQFQVMQAFSVPNYRHRGWLHTGEDWHGGRGSTLGQPVRAAAGGRVTLASPIVWGRDGGVIVLEHTFPDGTIYYSQYGHLAEGNGIRFPEPYTCVAQGDIIGIIAETRPAPHLHFEIRTVNPDLPGPGYTEFDPFAQGYRRPSKMIYNWQAQFHPAYEWSADLLDEAGPRVPPLVLADESLVLLDADRVLGLTPGGGVLWRINLTRSAAAIIEVGGQAVLVYRDGGLQDVSRDGALGESWSLGTGLAGQPLRLGEGFAFQTPDNALVGLTPDARTVQWRLPDVPPAARWVFSGDVLSIATTTDELLQVSADGRLLQRSTQPAEVSFALSADGAALAYAAGALWQIADPPTSGYIGASSIIAAPDGRLFSFENAVASALDAARQPLWQFALPGVTGTAQVSFAQEVILVTTQHGHVVALRASDGAVCGMTRIYGDDRAQVWHRLGQDGVLRVAVADQIFGFDWRRLLGPCA